MVLMRKIIIKYSLSARELCEMEIMWLQYYEQSKSFNAKLQKVLMQNFDVKVDKLADG